jgi:hypothetical protein
MHGSGRAHLLLAVLLFVLTADRLAAHTTFTEFSTGSVASFAKPKLQVILDPGSERPQVPGIQSTEQT